MGPCTARVGWNREVGERRRRYCVESGAGYRSQTTSDLAGVWRPAKELREFHYCLGLQPRKARIFGVGSVSEETACLARIHGSPPGHD